MVRRGQRAPLEIGEVNAAIAGRHYQRRVLGSVFEQFDAQRRRKALSGHAGVRATTPDRMPMTGPVPDLDACRAAYADIARGGPATDLPPQPTASGR